MRQILISEENNITTEAMKEPRTKCWEFAGVYLAILSDFLTYHVFSPFQCDWR